MRLLIVSQFFWPESFRINDLARGLTERGHAVTVLAGTPNYPMGRFFPGYGIFKKRTEDFHGVKVRRVPVVPRGGGGALRLALNYLSFAAAGCLLGPWVCQEDYDCILVYQMSPVTMGIPAILLKFIKKAPLLFWVQDLWPESLSATGHVRSRLILGGVSALVRIIYRASDRILIQSKAFTESVVDLGGRREKILYYPNSAEEVYQPMQVESDADERQRMPKGFCVMFAGNIGVAQDFNTILAAAELLRSRKDIHWVILGDGSARAWVEKEIMARNLGETVHLLGRHPLEAMPRYFAVADAMLVTLTKQRIFALTIPAKIQSYLACAKPIIAGLDGEGARIVQEAGAGLACPSGDPAGLAKAVLSMQEMPAEARRAMGERGRGFFEHNFERGLLLDKLEAWLNEVVGKEAEPCAS